jgi:hypothetical protein
VYDYLYLLIRKGHVRRLEGATFSGVQRRDDLMSAVVDPSEIVEAHMAARRRFLTSAAAKGRDEPFESDAEGSSSDGARVHVVEKGAGILQVGILDSNGRLHNRCLPPLPL